MSLLPLITRRLPVLVLSLALGASSLGHGGEAEPAADGPLTVISASLLGGKGDEEVKAIAVLADGTVLAGGSCAGSFVVPGNKVTPSGTTKDSQGFLATFGPDGRLRSLGFTAQAIVALQVGPQDRIYMRDAASVITIMDPAKGKTLASFSVDKADQPKIAIDSDGRVLAIAGKQLVRFDANGKKLWAVTPPAYGDNRPRACAVDQKSGIAVVVGYGMTHTGHEPWKDPYAHGYDRSGKLLWTLWNNPPKDQADGKYGGTGLMADGTAHAVCATGDGRFMITVVHDGGNAVTMRDPSDARKPIGQEVFSGSFQDGPGWGMKGAINTSVCFRVEAQKGTIEKGTWMCAWIENHARANTLRMENCASDSKGTTYVVGASAAGLPLAKPWFSPRPDEYTGGGFLAVFDNKMALMQSGPWNPGDINAVATNGGIVAIGGHAEGVGGKKEKKPIPPEEQMRLVKPVGQKAIDGDGDAVVVIFRRAGMPIKASEKNDPIEAAGEKPDSEKPVPPTAQETGP